MFRISKVEHLNSLTRWAENNPIKSLKTEIGASPSGDTFFIDFHEKYYGPHGLIAGTTGSGKSESIITVILSLAVNYSPEEVAFVIVDYKGGGLADAFNDTTFVSSYAEKHLTDFARYLARALAADSNITVAVLYPAGELTQDNTGCQCYSGISDFGKWNKLYKSDAEERCGKLIKNDKGEIVMSVDTPHVYVIINSFQKTSKTNDLNVTFNNLKLIINELPEIHYHYVILDTPENMIADRGSYIHIVKNFDNFFIPG